MTNLVDTGHTGDNTPLISVIIVNWNGQQWLKKCLDSLIQQTYKHIEIIVVDNGSLDGSVDFIRSQYPSVKQVLNNKNMGFGGGNNSGISKAEGKLVLLLNSDAWVDPELAEELVKEKNLRNLDVIGPLEADYWSKVKREPYSTHIDLLGHPVFLTPPHPTRPSLYLTGVCLLFEKSLYEATGGFDSNFFMYCEDVDWFWRLGLSGKTFDYSHKLFVYHAGGGSSGKMLNAKMFLWRNQNTLQMLLKNYSLWSLAWVLPLYFAQNSIEMLFFLTQCKVKIVFTYVMGWGFCLSNLPGILKRRRLIQRDRAKGDKAIMSRMYIGSGKAVHLVHRYK